MKRRTSEETRAEVPAGLDGVVMSAAGETYAILSFPVEPGPALPSGLTEAERGVVSLLLQGKPNREIARLRKVSPRTVANQLQAAYRKLGINSRSELAGLLRR